MQHTLPTISPVDESSYFKAHSDTLLQKTRTGMTACPNTSSYKEGGGAGRERKKEKGKAWLERSSWRIWSGHLATVHATQKYKAACFLQMKVHRPLNFLPRSPCDRLGCMHLFGERERTGRSLYRMERGVFDPPALHEHQKYIRILLSVVRVMLLHFHNIQTKQKKTQLYSHDTVCSYAWAGASDLTDL